MTQYLLSLNVAFVAFILATLIAFTFFQVYTQTVNKPPVKRSELVRVNAKRGDVWFTAQRYKQQGYSLVEVLTAQASLVSLVLVKVEAS